MRIDKNRSKKLQDQDAYVQLTLEDDELCMPVWSESGDGNFIRVSWSKR